MFLAAIGKRSAAISANSTRCFSNAAALVNADKDLHMKFGDRQGVSGVTATVFGAYGFVGRYVVNRLGRVGTRCVIPYRGDGMNTRHLKVMGDLGQIVQNPVDFTDPDSIRRSVEQSDVVINLVGQRFETSNYSFDDANVKVVHRLAKICAEGGNIKRFIHVSANGADPDAKSAWLQSKYHGEESVKTFFPDATIIRPCSIYGREDTFLNHYAGQMSRHPIVPIIGDGGQKVQPIYVQDVAQCIVNAMVDTNSPGKTYTLGGPTTYTRQEIIDFVAKDICREETAVVGLPEAACRLYAKAVEKILPKGLHFISQDDVDQMAVDNVVPKGALGVSDLAVKPVSIMQEGRPQLIFHRGNRDPNHGKMGLARGYGRMEDF